LTNVALTIDNSIIYTKLVECFKEDQSLKEKIEDNIGEYMVALTENLVKYTTPDDDPITVNSENFDIIT